MAINTVTILNKQNITFEFGICYFYVIAHCVFSFWGHFGTIFCDIKMEIGDKENRIAVIAIHKGSMEAIFKTHVYAWY